ncbi:hypothetical protein KUL152_04520 [Tenacibaculum sp. KUL152]|nr:hypothetical protein KUL152_04520 [Tenacibaculum sp. KUL152]
MQSKKSRDAVIKIKLQRLPKQCLSTVLTDLVGILLVLSVNNEKLKIRFKRGKGND